MSTYDSNFHFILEAKHIWFEAELKENKEKEISISSKDFENIMRIYESILKTPNLSKHELGCAGTAGSYKDAKEIWSRLFSSNYTFSSKKVIDHTNKAEDMEREFESEGLPLKADHILMRNHDEIIKKVCKEEELSNILDIQNLRIKEGEIRGW